MMQTLAGQVWFKFFFEKFDWVWNIDPVLVEFTLFGHEFSIRWYGLFIAVGVLLAFLYAYRRCGDLKLNPDGMTDVAMCSLLIGIVGARLYYVVFSDRAADYFAHPVSILKIWEGGLGIYGGIIFGVAAALLFCRVFKVDTRRMLDIAGLGLLIGQGLGRWGNFFNQEAFGGNTNLPWGMSGDVIMAGTHGSGYNVTEYVHPTFLYEFLWCLIGFILLHIVSTRFYRTRGEVFCGYLVWYGVGRFFIEALRTDSLMLGSMKVSQLVAVAAVVLGVSLFFGFRSWDRRLPTDLMDEPTAEDSEDPEDPEADPAVLAEEAALDGDPADLPTEEG